MSEVEWRLDHVTIGGSSLPRLEAACRSHDMEPRYGGRHANGRTHMSQVTFADDTYLELISTVDAEATSQVWSKHIEEDGGACGWAIRVSDVTAATERLRAVGVDVDGPERYRREREDGTEIEWEMAVPEPWVYPILLRDHTPLASRVGSRSESVYRGIDRILVATESLEPHVTRLQDFFESASRPVVSSEPEWEVACFEQPSLTLLAPANSGWLRDRLARFGEGPISFHFGRGDGHVAHPRTGLGSQVMTRFTQD